VDFSATDANARLDGRVHVNSAVTGHLKIRAIAFALLALLSIFSASSARGDGGIVRVRETQGPFIVTIFSPAAVTAGQPTDVTVMVQREKTGELVMNAFVDLTAVAPTGASVRPGDPLCSASGEMLSSGMFSGGIQPTFRATRAHSANKLLYGLFLTMHASGEWQLRVNVREGSDSAVVTCALPAMQPSSRMSSVWFCFAVPPVFVGLFALNQWLRSRSAVPRFGTA
jgi:hypothetical protein